ncbi:MAG: hypothetical protein P8Q52_17080, partial [Acidimicrobiales bacterium]|nr:hypothetical protein [Acidimicrobiales bacterium]
MGVDLDLVYDDALEWFVGGALALADELCDLPSRGATLLLSLMSFSMWARLSNAIVLHLVGVLLSNASSTLGMRRDDETAYDTNPCSTGGGYLHNRFCRLFIDDQAGTRRLHRAEKCCRFRVSL